MVEIAISTNHMPDIKENISPYIRTCSYHMFQSSGHDGHICFHFAQVDLINNTTQAPYSRQVTIYRRLLIGRDGHLDQSKAHEYIVTCTIIRTLLHRHDYVEGGFVSRDLCSVNKVILILHRWHVRGPEG